MSTDQQSLNEIAERWSLTTGGAVDENSLVNLLAVKVADALIKDPRKFMNDLYRLDVSEARVKEALRDLDPLDHPRKFAELILKRELEKAATRRAYEAKSRHKS